MTTLHERAVAEAEKLPIEDQDAIASRLLAEVEDERQWASQFAATTDDNGIAWSRSCTGRSQSGALEIRSMRRFRRMSLRDESPLVPTQSVETSGNGR